MAASKAGRESSGQCRGCSPPPRCRGTPAPWGDQSPRDGRGAPPPELQLPVPCQSGQRPRDGACPWHGAALLTPSCPPTRLPGLRATAAAWPEDGGRADPQLGASLHPQAGNSPRPPGNEPAPATVGLDQGPRQPGLGPALPRQCHGLTYLPRRGRSPWGSCSRS